MLQSELAIYSQFASHKPKTTNQTKNKTKTNTKINQNQTKTTGHLTMTVIQR